MAVTSHSWLVHSQGKLVTKRPKLKIGEKVAGGSSDGSRSSGIIQSENIVYQ